MRVLCKEYRQQKWVVHAIAHDFDLIDCWELPIDTHGTGESFEDVCRFLLTIDPADASFVSKILFGTRHIIGKIMRLDDEKSWLAIPKTDEMSLCERLEAQHHEMNRASSVKLPPQKIAIPKIVYLFENEVLLEVSNRTIYALMHFGKTDHDKIWLGIYIKSRGFMSGVYMSLIKPFRLWWVYPSWLRLIQRKWETRSYD
jgi:hypothetical protein